MTPERWKLIDELYHDSLDLDVGVRGEFLDQKCAGDQSLRREIEKLLLAHNKAGDFIETTAFKDLARTAATAASGQFEGLEINQYRIISQLGSGGMGEVYRAHDSKLERDVAIKVLPATGFGDQSGSLRLLRE